MKARPDEDAKEPRRWDFYVDFAGSDIRTFFPSSCLRVLVADWLSRRGDRSVLRHPRNPWLEPRRCWRGD
ncbi:MAG: hypothetical protein M1588_01620, partial [Planctomycetes bacterium]|nr:hypothetical protein [Planctomycetota bacterium]